MKLFVVYRPAKPQSPSNFTDLINLALIKIIKCLRVGILKHSIYIYAKPHSQRLKNQLATIWQPLVTRQKCVFPDWMQVVTDNH